MLRLCHDSMKNGVITLTFGRRRVRDVSLDGDRIKRQIHHQSHSHEFQFVYIGQSTERHTKQQRHEWFCRLFPLRRQRRRDF
jgi:hypothetical protein